MDKLRNLITLIFIFSFAVISVWSQESVSTLLEGYLKNDLSIQNLSAEVEKQSLNNESSQISNGFNFQLSTGTVTLYTGDSTYVKINPTASLNLPQYNDLTLSLSSKATIGGDDAGVSDTSINLSADIISEQADTIKISRLKAERSLLESKRALQNRFTSAEKEFYTSLKNLYQIAAEINTAENEYYEDKLSFDQIKAQGYTSTSSKYRTAQLEVLSDQHTIDTKKHELERETKVFANLCGINYQGTDAITQFLPNSIPLVDAVDVNSFPEETYTELEAALWTNKINQLERDAEKFFTLNANAGYTFANSSAGSSSKTDTVDFGTGMTFADTGLSASAGVSIPTTSENHNPIFTFGISIDPNAFRQAKITSQIEKLEAEQEAISIQSARNNYQTAVTTQAAELADIQWNKSSNTETYNLYKSLAADLQTWYKRGITTESEWRSAEVNKEKYRIQLLLNDIDLIIYNNETLLLFTRDQEFVSDKEGVMENEN